MCVVLVLPTSVRRQDGNRASSREGVALVPRNASRPLYRCTSQCNRVRQVVSRLPETNALFVTLSRTAPVRSGPYVHIPDRPRMVRWSYHSCIGGTHDIVVRFVVSARSETITRARKNSMLQLR